LKINIASLQYTTGQKIVFAPSFFVCGFMITAFGLQLINHYSLFTKNRIFAAGKISSLLNTKSLWHSI